MALEVTPLLIPVASFAETVGMSPSTVRRQLERGELRGERVGRNWKVATLELRRYRVRDEEAPVDLSEKARLKEAMAHLLEAARIIEELRG